MNFWQSKSKLFFTMLMLTAGLCFGGMIRADNVVFDAASDFSISNNPNGAWSYGTSSSLGGPFSPFVSTSSSFFNPNFEAWFVSPELHPFIAHNLSASNEQGGGLNLDPGQIALHPGSAAAGNLYAVLRWTAPTSTSYVLDAGFSSRDFSGATTDVHILLNGNSLLDGAVNGGFGPGSGPSFLSTLSVTAGDTIDFVVGNGGNDFISDSTGLDATFSTVPEPGASMVFLAVLSAGLFRRTRS